MLAVVDSHRGQTAVRLPPVVATSVHRPRSLRPSETSLPHTVSGRTFRRRRVVALCGLVLVLAGVWVSWQAVRNEAGPVTTPIAVHTWVVRSGDTLWGIAAATGHHGDIRPVVDQLSDQVGGRPLEVGESIVVP